MTRRGEDIPARHRIEALALLAVAIRDERAPLAIRITAARELLHQSEQTRPVSVADIASMTPEQRSDLWMPLVRYHEEDMPGSLRQMMEEAFTEALQRQASQPRRIGFVRGDRTANGGPRWPAASAHAKARRSVPSAQEKQ